MLVVYRGRRDWQEVNADSNGLRDGASEIQEGRRSQEGEKVARVQMQGIDAVETSWSDGGERARQWSRRSSVVQRVLCCA